MVLACLIRASCGMCARQQRNSLPYLREELPENHWVGKTSRFRLCMGAPTQWTTSKCSTTSRNKFLQSWQCARDQERMKTCESLCTCWSLSAYNPTIRFSPETWPSSSRRPSTTATFRVSSLRMFRIRLWRSKVCTCLKC